VFVVALGLDETGIFGLTHTAAKAIYQITNNWPHQSGASESNPFVDGGGCESPLQLRHASNSLVHTGGGDLV
jgi:hypothetical protein